MYSSFKNGTEAEGVGGALNGDHGAREGWRGEERCGEQFLRASNRGFGANPPPLPSASTAVVETHTWVMLARSAHGI